VIIRDRRLYFIVEMISSTRQEADTTATHDGVSQRRYDGQMG
jgi:hypothetical protein